MNQRTLVPGAEIREHSSVCFYLIPSATVTCHLTAVCWLQYPSCVITAWILTLGWLCELYLHRDKDIHCILMQQAESVLRGAGVRYIISSGGPRQIVCRK